MNDVLLTPVRLNEFEVLIQNSVERAITALSKKTVEPQQKEVLTRKETAALFAVSLVTIHDWVKSGILKPYKVGNRTYFKYSELMEVMNQSNPENKKGGIK